MRCYAVYKDREAAPWQGMVVDQRYEILAIDTPLGGIPWYETDYHGEEKTRWTSSACFEELQKVE